MNWLVTWMVISWSLAACPPPPPVYDVYRGEIQSSLYFVPAIACYDTEEKPMQKYFDTYDEALEFVNKGKEQCGKRYGADLGIMNACDLRDFEIIKLSD